MMNDDDVARYWDANAPTWARHVRKGYDTYRDLYNNPAFFAFCGDLKGLDVLDVGCGEGYNTRIWATQGARMTAVDISPEMIRLAREMEAREPLGIRYEVASANDLSLFARGTFDAVVSPMAMMDMGDYEGAVRGVARVLKVGGLFAFSVIHPCFGFGTMRVEQDSDGRIRVSLSGDYFAVEPSVEVWRFGRAPAEEQGEPFQVPRFPRTLSGYINPLAAGFKIAELHEPRSSDEACAADPRLRRWQTLPAFLYVKAVKER
jgi:ubiquinone/menaquinone biosynthesis C-methylase UbiE